MKIKRITITLLAVVLTAALTVTGSYASDTGSCGSGAQWSYSAGTLSITGSGDMQDYDDGYGAPWESLKDDITSISIAEGITSIGDYAFAFCDSLASVTFPSSLTEIGAGAFGEASIDGSLTIPDSVTEIGEYAFCDCSFNGTVTFGNGLETLGECAFYGCNFTGSLALPDSLTVIPDGAFGDCSCLDGTLTLGAYTEEIGYKAFYNCCRLTGDIFIPDTVTKIDDYAFAYCVSFDGRLKIGTPGTSGALSVLSEIGNSAFAECRGIRGGAVLPPSLESIGSMGFYGCDMLSFIDFRGDLPSVGAEAFTGCSENEEIALYYPDGSAEWEEALTGSSLVIGDSSYCALPHSARTDLDGDGILSCSDPVHLLWRIFYPDDYTVAGISGCDFNNDGTVNISDAVYLLWYIFNPETHPIE